MLPSQCLIRQSGAVRVTSSPAREVFGPFLRTCRRPERAWGVDGLEDDCILSYVHFITRMRTHMFEHVGWEMEVAFFIDFDDAAGDD
jgi:hypothetical protein